MVIDKDCGEAIDDRLLPRTQVGCDQAGESGRPNPSIQFRSPRVLALSGNEGFSLPAHTAERAEQNRARAEPVGITVADHTCHAVPTPQESPENAAAPGWKILRHFAPGQTPCHARRPDATGRCRQAAQDRGASILGCSFPVVFDVWRRDPTSQEFAIQVPTPRRGNTQRITTK
jgi:hypothetical protein